MTGGSLLTQGHESENLSGDSPTEMERSEIEESTAGNKI